MRSNRRPGLIVLAVLLALPGCAQVAEKVDAFDAYMRHVLHREQASPQTAAAQRQAATADRRTAARKASSEEVERNYRTGLKYLNGDGVPQDNDEAAHYLGLAAEQGHAEAQFLLGISYALPETGASNDEEAVKWFHRAAEQGHARARYQLGEAYFNGRGVARDPHWAALWYGAAAEQGHREAQFMLGNIYVAGVGAPADSVEAMKWLTLSAHQGHERAKQFRDALAARLTPEERTTAQARIENWSRLSPQTALERHRVRFVQSSLKELGYDVGPVDGFMGGRTQAAIADYKRRSDIAGAPEVNTALLDRLKDEADR